MTIRVANLRDIPALITLFPAVQSLHAKAEPSLFTKRPLPKLVATEFRKMMEDPKALLILAEDDVPCGYAYAKFVDRDEGWFWLAHRVCYISHVVVHRDMRRRGVARSLVSRLLTEASARGYDRIELDVWSFNQDAKSAFQKLGFAVFNERMQYIKKPPNKPVQRTGARARR